MKKLHLFLLSILTFTFFSCSNIEVEKVHLKMIVLSNLDIAEEAYAKLNDGNNFNLIAEEYSIGPNKEIGGDIGFANLDDLDKSIQIAVKNLRNGQFSEILKINNRYFILKKVEIKKFKSEGKKYKYKNYNKLIPYIFFGLFICILIFVFFLIRGTSRYSEEEIVLLKKNNDVFTFEVYGLRRFLNYIVDLTIGFLIINLFSFSIFFFFAKYIGSIVEILWIVKYSISVFIFLSYYIIFEFFFGQTIGKFITKTQVISINNNLLDIKSIIIRTLLRIIPFEPLSIITGKFLHDEFSKTIVISCKSKNS